MSPRRLVVVLGAVAVLVTVTPAPPALGALVPAAAPQAPQGGEEECVAWDVQCRLREAFAGWISETLAETVNLGLMVTSTQLLLTPELSPAVREAWGAVRGVTNVAFVLVITIAGILLMGQHSVHTLYGAREALGRITLGWVGANASWLLCDIALNFANAATLVIVGETATPEVMTETIMRYVNDPLGEAIAFAMLTWLAVLLAILLAFIMLIRLVLVALVVIVAPLALACHALPGLDGLARLWWRAWGGLLVIQIGQAIVLMAALRVFLAREGDNMIATNWVAGDIAIVIALLYILCRIPFWVFRRIFNYQGGPLSRAVKLAVSYLVLRNIGRALITSRTGSAARSTPPATRGTPAPRHTNPSTTTPASTRRWRRARLEPVPGIDSQIDHRQQQRLREQRRQTPLQLPHPIGDPAALRGPSRDQPPASPAPRAVQDPIPDLKIPPQTRTEPLFPVTAEMRRPPRHRVPRAQPHGSPQQRDRQALPPLPPRSAHPSNQASRPVRPRPRRGPPESDQGGGR